MRVARNRRGAYAGQTLHQQRWSPVAQSMIGVDDDVQLAVVDLIADARSHLGHFAVGGCGDLVCPVSSFLLGFGLVGFDGW